MSEQFDDSPLKSSSDSIEGSCETLTTDTDVINSFTVEHVFNVLILGAQCVGKSTLASCFVHNSNKFCSQNYSPTIGIDFFFRSLNVDGYKAKLQVTTTTINLFFLYFFMPLVMGHCWPESIHDISQ